MDSPNDGKELTPEFFYLPEFLTNSNKFDLGKLQSNDHFLNDVQLPPWAHDSPEEFIRMHRLALESDYVSAHLHEWIDLIFGYKQRGEEARQADNLFHYLTYGVPNNHISKSTEEFDEQLSLETQILEFGQVPKQV